MGEKASKNNRNLRKREGTREIERKKNDINLKEVLKKLAPKKVKTTQ